MRSLTGARPPTAPAAILAVLTVLAVLAGLAGCSDRSDPAAVARIGIGEPQHLLPGQADDPASLQVLTALFTPLVEIDEHGRPVAAAAATVEPDPAAQVWTVTLRAGFTFHNGEPVTADNYLTAWNFTAYQPNQQRHRQLFARIAGYRDLAGDPPAAQQLAGLAKVDENTFTVTLAEPFAAFPALLSMPAYYPLPEVAFAEPGRRLRPEYEAAPVGNGPFRIAAEPAPGRPIQLEPHAAYPGVPARLTGVELVVAPDPNTAYAALRDGKLDVLTQLPAGRAPTAGPDLAGRYTRHSTSAIQYLAIPSYQAELGHPDIRRAISMAIDRAAVAEAVQTGAATPAHSFVPPVVPGARPDTCGTACILAPDTARELYAEAGGPDRLTISYNADGGHREWVVAACRQLATHLDIECTPQSTPDLAELLDRVDREQPVGLVRLGWAMEYPSPESYLAPLFLTTGSANFSGYRNADFDALLATAATARSPAEATAAYQQAEDLLAQDLPAIPLWSGQHAIGHTTAVRDLPLTRLGTVDLARLEVSPALAAQW